MYVFEVELANADRGVYEKLEIRAAQHPSETADFLMTRVLAYCLEYTEGITFSKGLADRDEPTLFVRDLTGAMTLWVEIGSPGPDMLHQASKASPRVAVYCHKDAGMFLAKLQNATIFRAEALELYALDQDFLAGLTARLTRRMQLSLTVSEGHLYCGIGSESLDARLEILKLPKN
jgi:uncharacterized protein YaeQ